MSPSSEHQRLTAVTARALRVLYPNWDFRIDLPGERVPRLLGGYRPDILAWSPEDGVRRIVAEAKTDGDVDNPHTRAQLRSFVDYLIGDSVRQGTLILAINPVAAPTAVRVLRLLCGGHTSRNLRVWYFDGLDFWERAAHGGGDFSWHLR